jgi:hypothetical protein
MRDSNYVTPGQSPSSPLFQDPESLVASQLALLFFLWEPGALTGISIKWEGDTSLNALVGLVIRTRLVTIKEFVREKPHIFTNAQSSQEVQEVQRIYADLQELCWYGPPCI